MRMLLPIAFATSDSLKPPAPVTPPLPAVLCAPVNSTVHLPVRAAGVLQVASGSRVSGSFIAALEVLQQGDMTAAGAAVASLAWQQLHTLPTSLLWDLAWLVQDGMQQQDDGQVQLFGGLLRHYVQVCHCNVGSGRLCPPLACHAHVGSHFLCTFV